MNKIITIALLALLTLSGAGLAQQPAAEEKGPSIPNMMGQMMGGEKSGESGREEWAA